jgi:hypothetical protein
MIGEKLGPYQILAVICHCYRGYMKAQKQVLYVSIIIILFCSSAYVTDNEEKNPKIRSGEYLKSDYVDAIERTHSPYAAQNSSSEPTLLRAYKGAYDLILVHYFHEFYDGLNIMEDGKAHRIVGNGKGSPAVSVTVEGDNLILTDYDSNEPLHYIYVGDAQRFVARKVLVGDYVDAEGNTYSFREDGTAYFRDVQFPYEVGLDFVLRPRSGKNKDKRDNFRNSKSREIFEYELIDGVMYIYRTSGQEAMDVEPEPFLEIKRKNR